MADFNYHLNRQGPQGPQGETGPQGFSPSISVETNTAAVYQLRITNEDNYFITDNLRGSAVDDRGGTYMRYDPDTLEMFTGSLDHATTDSWGAVILADDEDVAGGSEGVVVTADQLYETNLIVDEHASTLVSMQTEIDDIEASIPDVSAFLTEADVAEVAITGSYNDLLNKPTIPAPANNGILTITQGGVTIGTFGADSSTNVTVTIPVSTAPNDGTLTIQKNGSTVGSFTANSSTNVTTNITVPTQLSDLSDGSTVVTQTTLETALQDYVQSTTLATVATSGDYDDLLNKPTIPSPVTITTTLDSQSTNSEVPGAATVYTALQGVNVAPATSTTLGTVQPDNTSITIDGNGVISATYTTPTTLVTTNTQQTISASKTFTNGLFSNYVTTFQYGDSQTAFIRANNVNNGRNLTLSNMNTAGTSSLGNGISLIYASQYGANSGTRQPVYADISTTPSLGMFRIRAGSSGNDYDGANITSDGNEITMYDRYYSGGTGLYLKSIAGSTSYGLLSITPTSLHFTVNTSGTITSYDLLSSTQVVIKRYTEVS